MKFWENDWRGVEENQIFLFQVEKHKALLSEIAEIEAKLDKAKKGKFYYVEETFHENLYLLCF